MTYRQTELYDETQKVLRSDWVDEFREPEYIGFQLVMHDVKSPLAWQIIESRRTDWKREQDARIQHLRLVFATYYIIAARNQEYSRSWHVETTAARLELTVKDVYASIRDALLFRVPGLMGLNDYQVKGMAA